MADLYMGRPCKRGHVGLRYASNSSCVACVRFHNGRRDREYDRLRGVKRREEFRDRQRRIRAATQLPAPLIWIYEFWSADHRCLYVGKTTNLPNRNRMHRAHPESASGRAFTEHAYMVLNMATDPETALIRARQPEYNERARGN